MSGENQEQVKVDIQPEDETKITKAEIDNNNEEQLQSNEEQKMDDTPAFTSILDTVTIKTEVNGTPNGKTNGIVSKQQNEKLEPEHFRKVFIGSLSYTTTDETLREYFCKFGDLVDCVIMKDSKTSKSRGFGFVTYSKSTMVDELMKNRPHRLDGRELETKRATPREDAGKPGAETSTKKLFVGAIKETITEDQLKDYFNKYGKIEDCVIMKDKETNKSRGFAFVTFDDYDPVDKIVLEKFHTVNNQSIAVKKALPKELTNTLQANGNNNHNNSNGKYNNHKQNGHHHNNNNNNNNNKQQNGHKNMKNKNNNFNNNNRNNGFQHQNNQQYNNNYSNQNQFSNNGYSNNQRYNNDNTTYDYNNDNFNQSSGYNSFSNNTNGNGYPQNGASGSDFNNPNMANFAMMAQKMLQTAMQMQQGGNGLLNDPPNMNNGNYNNGNDYKRNGNGMGTMPQVPPINPALSGFGNINQNQRQNFASDDFDGFDGGFNGPINNGMNRMNGNVGPVRPMQNNRQMGRVNGGPYPNGAGRRQGK
jgi:heterogeneous nuclear ribonucleoprotein A1/A3